MHRNLVVPKSARPHLLQNRSRGAGPGPPKGPFPGRPNPTFPRTAEAPLRNGRDSPVHSRVPLLLHPSFSPSLVSFLLEALFLATSVFFLLVTKSKSKSTPSKRSSGSVKTGRGPKRDSCRQALRGGAGSSPLPPVFLDAWFLLAVADFYILVLAGFCPILSISCTFLFRFSVQMHDLFPVRNFKP